MAETDRVGVICEGAHTDGPALELLLQAEFPRVHFAIIATDKATIFSTAGLLLEEMAARGVRHVIVLWDLHPVGVQMRVSSQMEHEKACRKDQRKTFLVRAEPQTPAFASSIQCALARYGFSAGTDTNARPTVKVVCFSESFDAVFLTDPLLLTALASTDAHEADRFPTLKDPETVQKPVTLLRQFFKNGPSKRFRFFNKLQHNRAIAQIIVEKGRLPYLRGHPDYRRLVDSIAAWTR